MFGIILERLSNDSLLFPSQGTLETSDLSLCGTTCHRSYAWSILPQKHLLAAILHTIPHRQDLGFYEEADAATNGDIYLPSFSSYLKISLLFSPK